MSLKKYTATSHDSSVVKGYMEVDTMYGTAYVYRDPNKSEYIAYLSAEGQWQYTPEVTLPTGRGAVIKFGPYVPAVRDDFDPDKWVAANSANHRHWTSAEILAKYAGDIRVIFEGEQA